MTARCSRPSTSSARRRSSAATSSTAVTGLYSALLYCQNLAASLAFYRDCLRLGQVFATRDLVMLRAGGSHLLLHRRESPAWPDPESRMEAGGHALTFSVEDADAWAARARESGVPILEGPLDQNWGRVVFVRDPDGRTVALAKVAP